MKKRYVIYFSGVFEHGYVRHSFIKSAKFIPFQTEREALDFASKFSFKMVADFYCWLYNRISEDKCDLRTYSVKVIQA